MDGQMMKRKLEAIKGPDAIKLDQSLPEHPYDRYVEHFDTHEALSKHAEQYEDNAAMERAVRANSRTRHQMVSQLSMSMYAKYGRQTFRLPSDLQQMFAHTSLSNITPSVTKRFPFPCFYMDLPKFGRKIHAKRTGWHEVKGAFVLDYIDHFGDRVWVVNLWGIENENSTHLGDDAQFSFGFSHRKWEDSGMDLEAYLEKRYQDTIDEVRAFDIPDVERQNRSMHMVLRMAVHLSLYLDSDPELHEDIYASKIEALRRALNRKQNPNSKKARRIRRKIDKITSSKVTVVAPSLSPESKSDSKLQESSEGSGVTRQRHWVRGHWRNQPYGSRDNPSYKMKWIKPHLRGSSSEGEITKRTYEVE